MKLANIAFAAVLSIAVGFAATPAHAGCGTCDKTIVENASQIDGFSTLVAAAKAAGLVETLAGKGPYTVFAPTDDAFGKLPEGTIASLLKPENKGKLTEILKYHVVPGKVMAKDVVKLDSATTAAGKDVKIQVVDGTVMINKSKVAKADVRSSNGVIHVIDTVLLPE
ncbi:MAG: fasciclin domain-containing protein [Planctomycetota bacterium]